MLLPAVPAVVLLQEQDAGASTLGTGNTIGPPSRHQEFAAIDRIGEEYDGLLQGLGVGGFHTSNLAGLGRFVKYIITLICVLGRLAVKSGILG